MRSIPVSLAVLGFAGLMAAALAIPVAANAADFTPPPPSQAKAFPYAYVPAEPAPAADASDDPPLVRIADALHDQYRYTRERVWPGYGGPRIEHEFGIHPGDPERPRNRHYYPYVWGGYAFSAPYFVPRREYSRPDYPRYYYGASQKYRWQRDFHRPSQWEDGRW